jgi:beta-glucosidase
MVAANQTSARPATAQAITQPADSPVLGKGFLFGAATAAFQIEGATGADGRIESIWDRFCATPGKVANADTGERACEHYQRWPQDLDLARELGLDAYRMSIAWPRVMGERSQANSRGIDFYKRLLAGARQRGLKTFVTLYHWDLPQHLQDRGGWLNRETAYRFADYADLMSRELAGLAGTWTTLNEPWVASWLGHGIGVHAPGLAQPRYATQAMHHLLLGHGLALQALRANDSQTPCGIVNVTANVVPHTPEDSEAALLGDAMLNRWPLQAVLLGRYPAELWRLFPGAAPLVLPGDMATISQKVDYLGVNYYFRRTLRALGPDGNEEVQVPDVERTQMGWHVDPEGLRDLLIRFKRDYANLPPIYITENGMASDDALVGGLVDDVQRVAYLNRHIDAVAQAMRAGVDLRGYFVWSLLDNFEWAFGYERRFGIVHVDFKTQVRTPKRSARALQAFLASRPR